MYKYLLLSLLAFSISGCSKDKSTTGEPAQQAMGMYAKGFNAALEVQEELFEYFEKIPEDGPEKGKKYSIFPRHNLATSDLKTIKDSFDAAKDASPSTLDKLAPLSDAIVSNLTILHKHYGEVHSYYDGENYKDDDYAKGIALHKTMTDTGKASAAAISAMGDALSGIEDEQAASELKKYEGDKQHGYWFRNFNVEAKKAVKAVEGGDAAKLASSLAAVETAHKGLAEFGAGVTDGPAAGAFGAYVGAAERFQNSLKKLNREVAGESKSKVDQLSSQVISSYNTLISLTNSLYQLEGNDLLK